MEQTIGARGMTRPHAYLDVVRGSAVRDIVAASFGEIITLVEALYRLNKVGEAANPPSQFLWFPNRDRARLITLSAQIGGGRDIAGVKTVASFPSNRRLGAPRASAIITLHDTETGFPVACVEGGIISATRTAASAVLAARHLVHRRDGLALAIVGTGLIAKYIVDCLRADGWSFAAIHLFDTSDGQAERFSRRLGEAHDSVVKISDTAEHCIASGDLVIFATTAMQPHVSDLGVFAHHPAVLNVSLRDIAPRVVIEAVNVVDDVDHCFQAETSLHLTEQQFRRRDFVYGDIVDLVDGKVTPFDGRTTIFSPFGMGILDVGLASYIRDVARDRGKTDRIADFIGDTEQI